MRPQPGLMEPNRPIHQILPPHQAITAASRIHPKDANKLNKIVHKQREPCPFEREYHYDEKNVKEHNFPPIENLRQTSRIFTTKLPYFGEVSKSKSSN